MKCAVALRMADMRGAFKSNVGNVGQCAKVPKATPSPPGYAKGQLISKQILKFSFEPKNQRKYFCISALASKKP